MPLKRVNNYYQWGNLTKYYYKVGNVKSRDSAKSKALKQARAVQVNRKSK
jgi:hypothetical protein